MSVNVPKCLRYSHIFVGGVGNRSGTDGSGAARKSKWVNIYTCSWLARSDLYEKTNALYICVEKVNVLNAFLGIARIYFLIFSECNGNLGLPLGVWVYA
jgi:hypothetical protein